MMNSVEDADLFWRPRLRPAESEQRRAALAAVRRAIAGVLCALALGVGLGLAATSAVPWALVQLSAPLAFAGG